MSGFSVTFFMVTATSPAMNSQLFRPLILAFSFAASTASSISSTPTTFFAFGATICPIVPVPQYRSKTTLSSDSPMKSLTIE